VVITHKKDRLLERTLKALWDEPVEIILIDDGGHDLKIVKNDLDRLLYIPVPHDGYRLALLSNIGIQVASGSTVYKIDGDCIPQPGLFTEIEPGELHACRIDWEEGVLRADPRFRPDGSINQGFVSDAFYDLTWGGCVAMNRATWLAIGGFREDVFKGAWGGEESDLGWRAYYKGLQIVFDPIRGVHHQWHPRGLGGAESFLSQTKQEYAQGIFPHPLLDWADDCMFLAMCDDRLLKVCYAQLRCGDAHSLSINPLQRTTHSQVDGEHVVVRNGGVGHLSFWHVALRTA